MQQLNKGPKLVCVVIGTGAGASSIYDGLTSSSLMLLADNQPFCLVDLGLGVGREVVKTFGEFPRDIIITHNHSDHAGDLPVVLRVELAKGNRCNVIGQTQVIERLKMHRVAEHLAQLSAEELADWQAAECGELMALQHGLSIEFYPGVHSELSFGFVIRDHNHHPRLSYTADSRLETTLYNELAKADMFILDARPKPNAWHAAFGEVKPWLKKGVYILGHGLSVQQIDHEFADLPLLKPQQRIAF